MLISHMGLVPATLDVTSSEHFSSCWQLCWRALIQIGEWTGCQVGLIRALCRAQGPSAISNMVTDGDGP